jgi:predicted KAP-like P-loop ATPase
MRDVSKKLKKCANKLELLENILSVATPVVKFIPGASEVIETGKNIISGMKNVAGSTSKVLHQDLHHIKDDIVKQLQNQKGKVLIIIDDLDRLLDEEVKNLMKMIKAVCDFPQTIYLLACDSKKVAGSLGSSNTDGHNYLEKIVQCTFNIPPPSRDKLNKLFLQNLEQIFELSQNKDLLFVSL